ncbi:sialidase family protein [Streptomyces sp. 6N223]|uniref:sialidase family protein n=1 Tax=Streptomyces sp. 6N223 TaxID=3457412 RepID=UPI003FD44828
MIDISTCRRVAAAMALALGCLGGVAAAPAPAAECAASVPFVSGTEGYHAFRIPAVVRAEGGVVVAFAEGRRDSLDDYGDIDVVARRSLDGGCTWEPMTVVADAGADTIGNPAPVVDPATGRITLLTCGNPGDSQSPRRVYVQHSDDEGRGWSAPREITAQVKPEGWDWYATGPGHGLALRHGAHAGRLLIPANHTYLQDGEERHGAHSLLSDDGGNTWRVGYVAQPGGEELELNENTFAELPDGRIYSNVRDHHGTDPATRADAYLAPGGAELLAPYEPEPGIVGPVVQGSTLLVEGAAPLLVYSGPASSSGRSSMTLRVSEDEGVSWREGPRLSDDPAAYSDLAQLDESALGLLYETGPESAYDTITFARVPTDEL